MAPQELRDNVSRKKGPSPVGRSIFVGLRAADILWQYALFRHGWAARLIESLGGHVATSSLVASSNQTWKLTTLLPGLGPYSSVVWLLALGSSLKQIAHILLVSEQEMNVSSAAVIAAFNTAFNSLNTILSLWALTSPVSGSPSGLISLLSSSPLVSLGLAAYTLGILTEIISEFQRSAFKKDPVNKGKPYGGGLFSLATNINYGGYTIWRAAYALVAGGLPWGFFTFLFFFYDFAFRGVPVLDRYLEQRYGEEYKVIKARVNHSLIPGIY